MSQSCNRIFHCVVDDVLDLQLVFVIGVRIGEPAEFLRQLEAVSYCLWRNEILRHFDATM